MSDGQHLVQIGNLLWILATRRILDLTSNSVSLWTVNWFATVTLDVFCNRREWCTKLSFSLFVEETRWFNGSVQCFVTLVKNKIVTCWLFLQQLERCPQRVSAFWSFSSHPGNVVPRVWLSFSSGEVSLYVSARFRLVLRLREKKIVVFVHNMSAYCARLF